MNKNLCSGCGFNFGTMETFEAHRIGKFGVDRRCMSINEMKLKGWEYSEPQVLFFVEGNRQKRVTPTWTKPVDQQEQQRRATLRSKAPHFVTVGISEESKVILPSAINSSKKQKSTVRNTKGKAA